MRLRFHHLAALSLWMFACGDSETEDTTSSSGPSSTSSTTTGMGGSGGAGGDGAADSNTSSTTTTSTSTGTTVDPWAGPLESLGVYDMGQVDIGQGVNVPIPDRGLGMTTLSEVAGNAIVGVYSLRPPGNPSVIFDFAIPGTALQVFADERLIVGGSPLSDSAAAVPFKSGVWRMLLGGDGGADTARTRVYVRRTNDGAFHGGVVDVNVLVAPSTGVSTNYLTGVVNALFSQSYGPLIGLQRGELSFATLPSSATVVGSSSEFVSLLESTAGVGSAPALNLLVVGDFTGDIGQAQGIAGGIPGSPMVHGTGRSGVAFVPTGNQAYDVSVLAHEIGHLAGLFHTTEIAVTASDPMSDTPTCASSTLNNNPNNCPDVSNVMFPIAYSGTVLSAGQVRVVRGSALYRGVLDEGGSPSAPLAMDGPGETWRARGFDPSVVSRLGTAPSLRPAAWAPRSELERLLTAHVCPLGPDGRVLELDDALLRIASSLAGSTLSSELGRIADDARATDVARERSLRLLTRSATEHAERAELARRAKTLLDDTSTPLRTTTRAMSLLAELEPLALDARRAALAGRAHPVVDETLRRLGR
jgi:hypothetical protein